MSGHRIAIRTLDIVAALCASVIALPLVLVLGLAVRLTSPGPGLFRQTRLGQDERPFVCLKIRTMAESAPSLGTHEISSAFVTPLGHVLRRLKLDELPQLWNVVKGEMSLVGPRPGLPNQLELADARRRLGVFSIPPGVTGPGQVNDVDMSTPERLAEVDATYALQPDVWKYLAYIAMTLSGRGQGDRVRGSRA